MSVFLEAPLESLCRKVTDGTHDSPKLLPDGVPFIKGKHISQGRLNLDYCDYISREDHLKVIARSKPERGDTLFSNIGSVGDSAFVNTDTEFSIKNVALFKPDFERVVPKYLFYLLRSPSVLGGLLSIRSGSAQPFIGLETLRKYRVRYHGSLSTQSQVVSILSAYDDLIENNTRRIEILEEMARRLYEEWFVQFRFPGHEGVAFKKMPIHDVADVVRGRSYRSADLVENGRPFVNLKCINRDGGYRRDGLKYYSGKYKPEQLVSSGDIVMAVTDMTQERRIVARAALVPDLGELQGVISMDLVRIIPKDGVSALYLYAFFRWSDFSDNVKNHATGANVLHLHPDLIANYDIDLPPQEVCKSFEDKVRPAIELADVLEKKNANLRAQRDLLLPRLISGEIDVSDIPMPT